MASGRLAIGEVPGLKSVPSATGRLPSMSSTGEALAAAIRNHGTGRQQGGHHRSRPAAASARAAIPAGDGQPR